MQWTSFVKKQVWLDGDDDEPQELCKQLNVDKRNQWYILRLESLLENETHEIQEQQQEQE